MVNVFQDKTKGEWEVERGIGNGCLRKTPEPPLKRGRPFDKLRVTRLWIPCQARNDIFPITIHNSELISVDFVKMEAEYDFSTNLNLAFDIECSVMKFDKFLGYNQA